MSSPQIGVTSEQLVRESLNTTQLVTLLWYQTSAGKEYLAATNNGQLSFVWEAVYDDGTLYHQYDEITFLRCLKDSSFNPPSEDIVSTERLDKKRVVKFSLIPTAFTSLHCPWFQRPYSVVLRPHLGERLLAYWSTDWRPQTNYTLRRQVIGIQKVNPDEIEVTRVIFVISPSGLMTMATNDNVSFETE